MISIGGDLEDFSSQFSQMTKKKKMIKCSSGEGPVVESASWFLVDPLAQIYSLQFPIIQGMLTYITWLMWKGLRPCGTEDIWESLFITFGCFGGPCFICQKNSKWKRLNYTICTVIKYGNMHSEDCHGVSSVKKCKSAGEIYFSLQLWNNINVFFFKMG